MGRRGAGPALLAAFLLAGCVTAEPLLPSPSAKSSSASISPAAAAPSDGRPSAAPSSTTLDPATARWTPVVEAGSARPGGELVGFDAGYVVLGTRDPFQEPIASFSTDGRRWAVTSLANLVPNCPGWGPAGDENVPDADVSAIATNGRQVIVVGAAQPHDAAGCGGAGAAILPVAWVSNDGLTWQRSAPFGGGRATSVWAVADGWLAVVDRTAWQSPDGLRWQAVETLPGRGPLRASGGPTADGARLLSAMVGEEGFSEARLFRSGDGRAWTPIDDGAGCEGGATQIVAPGQGGEARWVVLSDGRICTSVDLVAWAASTLPMIAWRVAPTRFGPIAIGDTCIGAGNTCPDSETRAYVLTDLGAWSRLAHPEAPFGRSISDGPAGVLMTGSGPDAAPDAGVWLLEP